MKRHLLLLSSVLCLLSPAVHAGNIYPIRVSDGSTTGDVDTLRFSGGTLAIGSLSGGGRMGTLTISGGSGGGGGTNFQTSLGIVFTGNAGSLSIGVNPSLVLTAGSPVSAIAGALGASSTNNLADKSLVTATSNTIMQAVNAVSNAVSVTLIPSNGVLFVDLGGDSNALAIDPSVVVTAGAPFSVLAGLVPLAALPAAIALFPTNGLNVTTSLGATFSNGVLVTQDTVTPLTNATSATPALLAVSAAGGVATITPNPGLLTNSGSQPFFWNGTLTISNNATVTGTFTVNGTLNASNISGVVTSAVATVNGLVSNVTLTATGNATVSTVSSSGGGTVTVDAPHEFAETNPASASPSALFWDTKYGALRCSNNFGATFIDTPQLSGMSNVVDSMSSWFTSTTTDAWINVNVPSAWNIVNTNNHLLIQSTGEVANSRWLLMRIANTNESWAYRILLDDVQDGSGTSTFNVSMGVGASEGTNANFHALTLWRTSGTTPSLRGFVASTPGAVPNTVDTGGADPGGTAQSFYTGGSSFSQIPSPLWLQVGYDGSTNLYYEMAFVRNGLPPIFNIISTKTNQTVMPGYVGLIFEDTGNFRPTYFIKAAVFEQPWSLGQP